MLREFSPNVDHREPLSPPRLVYEITHGALRSNYRRPEEITGDGYISHRYINQAHPTKRIFMGAIHDANSIVTGEIVFEVSDKKEDPNARRDAELSRLAGHLATTLAEREGNEIPLETGQAGIHQVLTTITARRDSGKRRLPDAELLETYGRKAAEAEARGERGTSLRKSYNMVRRLGQANPADKYRVRHLRRL